MTLNDKKIDQIISFSNAGLSDYAIGKRLKVDHHTVKKYRTGNFTSKPQPSMAQESIPVQDASVYPQKNDYYYNKPQHPFPVFDSEYDPSRPYTFTDVTANRYLGHVDPPSKNKYYNNYHIPPKPEPDKKPLSDSIKRNNIFASQLLELKTILKQTRFEQNKTRNDALIARDRRQHKRNLEEIARNAKFDRDLSVTTIQQKETEKEEMKQYLANKKVEQENNVYIPPVQNKGISKDTWDSVLATTDEITDFKLKQIDNEIIGTVIEGGVKYLIHPILGLIATFFNDKEPVVINGHKLAKVIE